MHENDEFHEYDTLEDRIELNEEPIQEQQEKIAEDRENIQENKELEDENPEIFIQDNDKEAYEEMMADRLNEAITEAFGPVAEREIDKVIDNQIEDAREKRNEGLDELAIDNMTEAQIEQNMMNRKIAESLKERTEQPEKTSNQDYLKNPNNQNYGATGQYYEPSPGLGRIREKSELEKQFTEEPFSKIEEIEKNSEPLPPQMQRIKKYYKMFKERKPRKNIATGYDPNYQYRK